MSEVKSIISIYQEGTPNPEQMKFVTNRMLYTRQTIDFPNADSVNGRSDLAEELFGLSDVKSVFIANNFVTVGKHPESNWLEIVSAIKELVKNFLEAEKAVVNKERIDELKAEEAPATDDDGSIESRIKDLLAKYVQPAVEMDGGSIVFRNYENGIVTLGMQGACSGCPSSSVTLKAGIEGMMKRMIPEVTEVVAENM